MVRLIMEIKEDLSENSVLRPRVFNRAFKRALRNVVAYWHQTFFPIHFKKAARYRYASYERLKRRSGEPFVLSGTLRERLTDRGQLMNISGTANSVRLRMKFGRPPQYRKDRAEKMAWAMARREKIPFDEALGRVYRKAGYSPHAKKLFADLLPETNPQEERAMARRLRDTIVYFANGRGDFKTGRGAVARPRGEKRATSLRKRYSERNTIQRKRYN